MSCFRVAFLFVVKYLAWAECWFITKAHPGLEEIARNQSCEIL